MSDHDRPADALEAMYGALVPSFRQMEHLIICEAPDRLRRALARMNQRWTESRVERAVADVLERGQGLARASTDHAVERLRALYEDPESTEHEG